MRGGTAPGLSSQGSNVAPDMKAGNPGEWLWGCYFADQNNAGIFTTFLVS
jgi:FtsP/CotA-like multicopper oxidase with cupredoxin domain